MALKFALRGGSLTAQYAGGSASVLNLWKASVTADAGVLGGNRIAMTDAGLINYLVYEARNSLFSGNTFSVLCRIKSNYSGAPAASNGLWNFGLPSTNNMSFGMHHHTTGQLRVHCVNESLTVAFNEAGFAWSPVSGTQYDLFWSWDGTTNANQGKMYVDSASLGTLTAAAALSSSLASKNWSTILAGWTNRVNSSNFSLIELVIWDTVVDPTSVALVSGTGSLNGASRTSFVSAASFDGSQYTNPGTVNVRANTAYTFNGTIFTGSAAIPSAANVRSGTQVDAGVGTASIPARADVRSGTAVDASTGTLVVPSAGDVKLSTVFDNGTVGTYTALQNSVGLSMSLASNKVSMTVKGG